MKPDWERGGVQLYCGDCLAVLPSLAPGSVDAVVTDPPFFCPATHYQSRVGWQRKWSDMSILTHWWGTICDSVKPSMREAGHFLVFCNADSYPSFYPAMYSRWQKLNCLVWDKCRPGLGRVWRHQHELIITARDSGFCPNDGRLRPDVLRFKASLSRDREHPVEKPPEMLAELIGACTPPGPSCVLDPFAGSGTTAVAAVATGRRCVVIEQEPDYCEIIKRRVTEAQDATALLEHTA